MRQEVAECLNLGNAFSEEVLKEKLITYLMAEEEQSKVKEEMENSIKGKHMIPNLPLQDTFWHMKKLEVKIKDLSHLRILVMSDVGLTHPSIIQYSLVQAADFSYEDQALQLLCYGCFYPLDGKRSRRPRFLFLNDSQRVSNIQLESEKYGIYFCGSMPPKDELSCLKKRFQNVPHIRQCSVCGISGTPDLFHECDKCDAVLYCGKKCQKEDWDESHQEWCLCFKDYMAMEPELADLPFHFTTETTKRNFDKSTKEEFLKGHGVYGQGLWGIEVLESSSVSTGKSDEAESLSDGLLELCSVYGLETESSLLQVPPQPSDKPLAGWADYYLLRGFSLNSVISVLLHFPLTVYYIVSQLLPVDFHEAFASIQQSKKIEIHLIGAEKEVEMFYPYLECARLLAPLSVHIDLFGNKFDSSYHNQTTTKENLHFEIHKGLYHRMSHEDIPKPSLAVCLNGGIGAYTSYFKTVKHLMKNKIPFYYTDYGQASIAFSNSRIVSSKVGQVSQPQVNPYRCPLRMMASDQNLPRYSNAFICHITPFSQDANHVDVESLNK